MPAARKRASWVAQQKDQRPPTRRINRTDFELPYNGAFTSPIVQLKVGDGRQILCVHENILTSVEFFESCLREDSYIEGQTKTIDFPNGKPEAIDQVIHFLYTGRLAWDTTLSIDDPSEATRR